MKLPKLKRKTPEEKQLAKDSKEKEKQQKASEKLNVDLNALGLGGVDISNEPKIDIAREGLPGTLSGHIGQATLSDVRENYSSVPEYLRVKHGPGTYNVTLITKGQKSSVQRIVVADVSGVGGSSDPASQQPFDPNAPIGIPPGGDPNVGAALLASQVENARLQSELSHDRDDGKTEIYGTLVTTGLGLLKEFLTAQMNKGSSDSDAVGMMKAATETMGTLMEMQAMVPNRDGGDGTDVGSVMQGIAGIMQGLGQQNAGNLTTLAPETRQPAPPVSPAPPVQPVQTTPPTTFRAPDQIQTEEEFPQVDPNVPEQEESGPDSGDHSYDEQVGDFIDSIGHAVQQRQEPSVIAEYFVQNIEAMTPEQIAQLQPEVAVIVSQMQQNPLLGWDHVCSRQESIRANAEYANEIRAEIQKMMVGSAQPEAEPGAQA